MGSSRSWSRASLFWTLALFWTVISGAQAEPGLNIGLSSTEVHRIDEGGQLNLFLDDPLAQVHLLVKAETRIVFAFPAENSGIGIWFDGHLRYKEGTLKSQVSDHGQAVTATFEVLQPIHLDTVLLDSLRVLRERQHQTETPALIQKLRQEKAQALGLPTGWSSPQVSVSEVETLLFTREQPGVGSFVLELAASSGPIDSEQLIVPEGLLTLVATVPFSSQEAYHDRALFRESFLPKTKSRELDQRATSALKALRFLVREDKMMAGSWRFLTYFGRDTLISLSMLEPILSDRALENGIKSVLTRLSPEGAVAHEEDVGPFAEWHHLRDEGKYSLAPVFDYKMIDDDLLLPIVLKLCLDQNRLVVLDALFADPESREAILTNLDYVLGKMSPKKPLRLLPGEMTGDWRDSNEGLGRGVYPSSVNAMLALPALDAMVALGQRYETARGRGEKAQELRPAWETIAEGFLVTLSPDHLKARAAAFEATLSPAQKQGFQLLKSQSPDAWEQPLTFTALALDDNLDPVEIPSSDVCFTLFYANPSQQEVTNILDLLERPWPAGLMTAAGPLVVNPALSADALHYRTLGFGAYHGLVVWSWPSSMLQLGLFRQAERHPELKDRLMSVAKSIAEAEKRVGDLANSELWAIDLGVQGIDWRAFGGDLDETESNALQLWSTVYPVIWHLTP